jgi:hypothetical protein
MNDIYRKIKEVNDKDAGEVFSKEILSMSVDLTKPKSTADET